ncbi:hypothetical protein [Micromonospora sp. NPDC005806]|uniref:hypothetical protein n=1 Tax=Micromonospora sp. NPDC005806 TaxID=3364234 RepID=UPI0036C91BD2
MADMLNFAGRLAAAYVVYAFGGLLLFLADLVVFSVLARLLGALAWLAVTGWGVLALAYAALTVGLVSHLTLRVAPQLHPADLVRQRRTVWLGGAPLAAGALVGALIWVAGNGPDAGLLILDAKQGEAEAMAIWGALGTMAGTATALVYAVAVLVVRPRR